MVDEVFRSKRGCDRWRKTWTPVTMKTDENVEKVMTYVKTDHLDIKMIGDVFNIDKRLREKF
jgi:hypothetical protein